MIALDTVASGRKYETGYYYETRESFGGLTPWVCLGRAGSRSQMIVRLARFQTAPARPSGVPAVQSAPM